MNILVNLPAGFFRTPASQRVLARLDAIGTVRRTSHNTAEEIAGDLAWAEAVIMWSWPKLLPGLLDKAPKLRFAGHLDLSQEAAKVALSRGLPVSVTRAAFSPAVSEMALTLILACLRRTSTYHMAMRRVEETWVESFPDDIDPRERQLTGRRVGLVGFGRIGRRLAELLAPFHVELRVADPYVPAEAVATVYPGAKKAELDDLLRESEIVVICAASNPGSNHLIGREQIALLPTDGVFVNVARAALVDTGALVDRLRRGDLSAAVDVFDREPLPPDHPLRTLPNAYLTPHRAGGVMESVERILGWLVDDLEAHLAGRPRQHALVEAMVPALDA